MESNYFKIRSCNLFVLLFFSFMSLRLQYFIGVATVVPIMGAYFMFLFFSKLEKKEVYVILLAAVLFTFMSLRTDLSLVGVVKVISCIFIYFISLNFSKSINKEYRHYWFWLLTRLVVFAISFAIIEAVLRIGFGENFLTSSRGQFSGGVDEFIENSIFYKYKIGSPFFTDSNFVGLYLLPFWFLYIVLKSQNDSRNYITPKFHFIIVISFSILALLTFSRSYLFVFVFFSICVYVFQNIKRSILVVLTPLFSFAFSWTVSHIFTIVRDDFSFQTKLKVWTNTFNNFSEQSVSDIMFGNGFANGKFIFSYAEGNSAHAMIPQLLGEIGLLGLLLYLAFLLLITYRIQFGFLFFISILLLGFSLFDSWEPLYFGIIGIVGGMNHLIESSRRNFFVPRYKSKII